MFDSRKRLNILFITVLLILNNACLNRQFIDGHVELISSSDTTLNDSSIFLGHVFRQDFPDTNGYYSIITEPGIFTIKCQSASNNWQRLIEEMEDIEVPKNKKFVIDFYIGYTIE